MLPNAVTNLPQTTPSSPPTPLCPNCDAPTLIREDIPYLQNLAGQLIILPDVPALVCTTCEHTQLEPELEEKIHHFLAENLANIPAPSDKEQRLLKQIALWKATQQK